GDQFVRECLFDPDDNTSNILNTESAIYEAIARLAKFRIENRALRFGRMFVREISSDGIHFKLPDCNQCTLAFSRVLHDQETLYVFNSSTSHPKGDYIRVGTPSGTSPRQMKPIYGLDHSVDIRSTDTESGNTFFIQLSLNPTQLIILHNVQ
ncbi:MAG: alpha-amylase, partial [Bacteroidetes bacterium]|nr:alpha-amylase [Bacteroidota bacterium]